MRVLQVGAGGFGRTWLTALASEPAAELVALVDRDPAALVDGVPGFTDLDAALATEADLAVVVVPPSAHREVAERCLAAGLPVLDEKPLAGAREGCEAAIGGAQRLHRPLPGRQHHPHRPPLEAPPPVLARRRA